MYVPGCTKFLWDCCCCFFLNYFSNENYLQGGEMEPSWIENKVITNQLIVFDLNTNQFQLIDTQSTPSPRPDFGIAEIADDIIIILGGDASKSEVHCM